MLAIATIGLDLAKLVFQVHALDAAGNVVTLRAIRRSQLLDFFERTPPCLVGMEACASAHYWTREIGKFGHQVRIMPASYVKAYVKRNKTDAADAEAICEAVTRPTMQFVPVKSDVEQSVNIDGGEGNRRPCCNLRATGSRRRRPRQLRRPGSRENRSASCSD